jgi:regulator of nucleoside diphosphate kinase
LVYPKDVSLKTASVSVLSPVGSALLGLKVGQAIEWPFLDGHRERYRVLAVAYQPEAAGHFHL